MNHAPPLDLTTIFIALGTLLFGQGLANVIGPYAVIFLGAMLGGGWSLSQRDQTSRMSAGGYLILIVGLALLITVPLAILLEHTFPYLEIRWTLGPVAAIIGGIGQKWPQVFKWGLGLLKGIAEVWAASRAKKEGPDQP